MSMTFYYAPMTSSIRPYWALEELGVPYEKVKLDLGAGDHKKPEYLALNPNGKVPLLVVDGLPVFESLAILLYLGETYGVDKGLYPAPGLERADALRWMAWSTASLTEALVRVLRNKSERFPAEERNEKAAESGARELQNLFGILDRALEGKEYLVGGRFTLADLAVASFLPMATRLGVDINPYKNVVAWSGRCMTRPALGRAMMG
ncbi:MAG: glutathione S-transferase family protein [Polyangiaceae bacterium]|nr:glutathione S-transferase family protein [Polyangiaceae bacterium]